MTNNELHGYKPFTVNEGHFHLSKANTVDDSVQIYRNIFDCFGYSKGALMVYQHDSGESQFADNAKALYIKDVFNRLEPHRRLYALGGLYFNFDERDTSDGFYDQVKLMYDMGMDGVKILEGKTNLRKALGRPIDDPIYDRFYAFIEEHDLPVTMHVAGPASCWDPVNIPDFARRAGWLADESTPPFLQFREETEGLLRKFPKMRLTLAHFFFISHDIDNAVRIMETYPNVSFDLTPNSEMYADFTKRVPEWREFFKTYADRIIFGTDTYNQVLLDDISEYVKHPMQHRINLVRRAIETSEPFEDTHFGTIKPLGLDDETLIKIYGTNFDRMYGEVREVDRRLTAEYARRLLDRYVSGELDSGNTELNALEISNLRTICSYFLGENVVK